MSPSCLLRILYDAPKSRFLIPPILCVSCERGVNGIEETSGSPQNPFGVCVCVRVHICVHVRVCMCETPSSEP